MPRQEIPIGKYGDISYTACGKNWRARTRYRDLDGVLRHVERLGKSKSIARANLVEDLDKRRRNGDAPVTPETTLADLADLWLLRCQRNPNISEQTLDRYRKEINVPTDKRATASSIKIKKALGSLKVKQVTPATIDRHLAAIVGQGHAPKAKLHLRILRGMMALAVKHEAIELNPVRDQDPITHQARKTKSLGIDQLQELRTHLRAWLADDNRSHGGIPRSAKLVQAADILLATGARPGEVLGLRRCDVDRSGPTWKASIAGTLVHVKGQGYFRQAHTKTGEGGRRTVWLPNFAKTTLLELGAANWDADSEALVFPDRNGNPWNTNNFGRSWRAARGDEWAWVMPKTFRITVSTILIQEADVATAGHQLGHIPGSPVTNLNYHDRGELAPDSTHILERLVGSAS